MNNNSSCAFLETGRAYMSFHGNHFGRFKKTESIYIIFDEIDY